MPRPQSLIPEMRYHVSGQSRVWIDGRYVYLGDHGEAETQARYDTLIAKYLANGRKLPPEETTHKASEAITVENVMAEYERLIDSRPTLEGFRHLCVLMADEYGPEPAAEFGPRKLSDVRDLLVLGKAARPTINKQIRQITLMFKHAVSREMIDVETFTRLQTLEPLLRGQTTAGEYKRRQPADIDDVRAAAAYLSPIVRGILTVQLHTGMRPSEVFAITPGDIDRGESVWFYRPKHHKTAGHGIVKAVRHHNRWRSLSASFAV